MRRKMASRKGSEFPPEMVICLVSPRRMGVGAAAGAAREAGRPRRAAADAELAQGRGRQRLRPGKQ